MKRVDNIHDDGTLAKYQKRFTTGKEGDDKLFFNDRFVTSIYLAESWMLHRLPALPSSYRRRRDFWMQDSLARKDQLQNQM